MYSVLRLVYGSTSRYLYSDFRLVETAKSVKSLGLKDNTTNQIRMKIY